MPICPRETEIALRRYTNPYTTNQSPTVPGVYHTHPGGQVLLLKNLKYRYWPGFEWPTHSFNCPI
jgi:hypothetical protein